MVNIKDIAKRAGVSISTVSYALNNNPRISEETRQRIVALAEEMNYVPNMAGRNLRRKKTDIIAVYLASFGGNFYSDLLEGVMEEATEQGYEMIVCSGVKARQFLPERMVDGALVIDTSFPDEEILSNLALGRKMVVMDRICLDDRVPSILLDNTDGATQAVQELLRHGKRRFYFVSGPEGNFDSETRLAAGIEILENEGYEYRILPGDFTYQTGLRAGQKMLEEWSEPISVFCLNDDMAIGVLDAFQDSPYRIGEDVKLVGFDNSLVGKYTHPSITSIAYSKHRWGKLGARALINSIKKEPVANQILKTNLVQRESSK